MTTYPENVPVLYHGTTAEAAEILLREGWSPRSGPSGANCGQSQFLYLTNYAENALWFAAQKGASTVVAVSGLAWADLDVDPEDGIAATVQAELFHPMGLAGSVVLKRALGPEHFGLDFSSNPEAGVPGP